MSTRSRSTPRIFVSHSHKDHEVGIKLVRDLRMRLGDEEAVWYDKSGGLRGGDIWFKKIKKVLKASNVFIVLLSPSARRSRWVKEEIDIALHYQVTKKMLIIPLLYLPCRIPDDLKRIHTISCLPPSSYNAALEELFETLEKHFQLEMNTLRNELDDEDIAHLQLMTERMQTDFNNEDWYSVIALADALINRYEKAIPVSIYQMQGLAYIFADKIYANQYKLAQHAIKEALAQTSEPKERLVLLDAYIYLLVLQDKWDDVETLANEAIQLAPNNSTWQIIQKEAIEKVGKRSFTDTSQNEVQIDDCENIGRIETKSSQVEMSSEELEVQVMEKEDEQDFQIEAQKALLEVNCNLLELKKKWLEEQKAQLEFEKDRIAFAFEVEGWSVPVFLFRFHTVEFQQLEILRQTGKMAKLRPGRTGDDCLAFQLNDEGHIIRYLYCEAKCTSTGRRKKMIADAYKKASESVLVDLPQIIEVLLQRRDELSKKWLHAIRQLWFQGANHKSERYNMVSYVCGKSPQRGQFAWLPVDNPPEEYKVQRRLEAVEVHLPNVESLIREVYHKKDDMEVLTDVNFSLEDEEEEEDDFIE